MPPFWWRIGGVLVAYWGRIGGIALAICGTHVHAGWPVKKNLIHRRLPNYLLARAESWAFGVFSLRSSERSPDPLNSRTTNCLGDDDKRSWFVRVDCLNLPNENSELDGPPSFNLFTNCRYVTWKVSKTLRFLTQASMSVDRNNTIWSFSV